MKNTHTNLDRRYSFETVSSLSIHLENHWPCTGAFSAIDVDNAIAWPDKLGTSPVAYDGFYWKP